jgi:tetratricopeptide (TPR) repeat protein
MKKRSIISVISFLSAMCFSLVCYADEGVKENPDSASDSETEECVVSSSLLSTEKIYEDSIVLIKKQLESSPQNEQLLVILGRLQKQCKQISDAFSTYNKLVQLNPGHYDACLFLGCYHYVHGKKMLDKEDSDYKEIKNPKKMQYASYQNNVKKIVQEEYVTASVYLESALSMKKTSLVADMLQSIYQRIAFPDPGKDRLKK